MLSIVEVTASGSVSFV